MKYPEKIEAAKYLYRRCSNTSIDSGETLLKVIENALMAGMERSDMKYNEAVEEWLIRVVKIKNRYKENANDVKFERDEKERKQFLIQEEKSC